MPLNAVPGFATQLLRDRAATSDMAQRGALGPGIEDARRHLLRAHRRRARPVAHRRRRIARRAAPGALARPGSGDALPLVAKARGQLARRRARRTSRSARCRTPTGAPARQVLLKPVVQRHQVQPAGRPRLAELGAGRDAVVLRVHDDGRGIDEARLRHVFQPSSAWAPRRAVSRGTGIGLAIVKALVEAMGGRVAAQRRRAGHGVRGQPACRLGRCAPCRPRPTEGVAGRAAAPAAVRARVLYVEDDAVNALLVRELLASRGTSTSSSPTSGAAGLEGGEGARPDLVLLD